MLKDTDRLEAGVPGRTISSVVDESVARSVTEQARIEDRTPSQVVNAAVRFYLQLPAATRRTLRRIEAHGTARLSARVIARHGNQPAAVEVALPDRPDLVIATPPRAADWLSGAPRPRGVLADFAAPLSARRRRTPRVR